MNHIKKIWFNQVMDTESKIDFLFDFLDMIERDDERKNPRQFRIIIEEIEKKGGSDCDTGAKRKGSG
jgi:Mor family transcriptional regulator